MKIVQKIRSRTISPQALIENSLRRIESLNEVFHAYLATNPHAIGQAQQRGNELKSGQWRGPLHGMPISIKDLVQTADLPTTAGSKVVSRRINCGQDAALIKRLREAGAIILGKTNLHEFAYGVTTENFHFGTAVNPWNNRVVAGGSSGGSAVSVATEMCQGSVGTDTRGSIRIPAAACGVTGFKPTAKIVPMSGVVPLSPSLDHAGPIARTAEMAAVLVSCMAQDKSLDPYISPYEPLPSNFQIGVSTYHMDRIDLEIKQAIWRAIDIFKQVGVSIKSVNIDGIEDALHASTIITSVEALQFHRPLMEKQPEAYGPKVLERLEAGQQYSAAELEAAQMTQKRIASSFAKKLQEVNCLIGATLPCLPSDLGADSLQINGRKESVVNAFTRLNAPQNLSGIPALALPCGFSKTGLPLSMQVMGARGQDRLVLQVGQFYQTLTDWHRRNPF